MSAYGTLIGADAYHLARGNTAWAGDNADKDIARLRGSDYIDQAFRSSFPGERTNGRNSATPQDREWPRTDAYDIDGALIPDDDVPQEVIDASYEAALRELVSPGSLMPDYDPSSQAKREKVDVIEVEYTAAHGVASVMPIITAIRAILAPILTGNSASGIVGRFNRI